MGINHVLQVRKVQGEEERAMKRYDLRIGEFLDQRIDIVEQDNGKYVKYSDIKDDRALLEEMYEYIKTDVNADALCSDTSPRIKTKNKILARAKERLG
jgi:hypothetical protein